LYFQNGVSGVMEQLVFFHDHTMIVMVLVMVVVGYLLVNSLVIGWYNRGIHEGQELESVWTVIPAGLLLVVAFPSLRLLYLMEEGDNPELTVKVVGHQWY
jgi:cytochrome c oxidase subunit 2